MQGYFLLFTRTTPKGRLTTTVETCNTKDHEVALKVLAKAAESLKPGQSVYLGIAVATAEAARVEVTIKEL